ncbi:MAG: hypothetical protein KIT72_07230 [Polyangiaceae bacterium]|nr:hypothetical protein [Polyangiaceae bacterium]MCW5790196.1 hypothetical protein [Polyangiaceae bacterium]
MPWFRVGWPRAAGLAWVLGGLALACGGPRFDGRVYTSSDLSFQVDGVPAGWREIEASHGLVSFRDDARSATLAVSGRCGQDGDDVPLTALTHHLFLQFTERSMLSQRELELDGRAALRTEIEAKLDGVAKRFVVYVLKKNGCVYDFVHIGPPGTEASAEFERFVASFRTLSP